MSLRNLSALTLATLLVSGADTAPAAEVVWVGAIQEGLTAPMSLAVDENRIAVLEPYIRQIAVFSTDGLVQHRLDIEVEARALARLHASNYLFCDPGHGTVVASDVATGTTRSFTDAATEPVDVAVSGPHVYVLDAAGRVLVTDLDGTVQRQFPLVGADGTVLTAPASMVWDAARERFHVLDQVTCTLTTFAADGTPLGAFGSFGTDPGQIARGGEIACDRDGYVYVCDRYQGRVVVFDDAGEFVIHMDPLDLGRDRLLLPTGIAVDPNGLVYVASTESRQIQLLYLDKQEAPGSLTLARPVYPADRAAVACQDLRLVAEIEVPAEAPVPSGADFRLLLEGNENDVLAEARNVPIATVDDGSGGTVRVTEWRPDLECVVGTHYAWQVRPRSGEDVGPWSTPRSFVAQAAGPSFQLGQNYPNPFALRTVIPFRAPAGADVRIQVFDIQGRVVWARRILDVAPGVGDVRWDGRDSRGERVASGVYFYRLDAEGFSAIRKLVRVR